MRNIIAHHSRLWNRVLITKYSWPSNLTNVILSYVPDEQKKKKVFPIMCAMIYMNDKISSGHSLRKELHELIQSFPNTAIYKMGFPQYWFNEPIFL
ncbi:hypothetical protein [Sphingobacterium multivorum]|uniref:hypothetical protein n=1 Tax=Sphingobacterium multivorum TaxID=28454 RepID=UPI003DA4C911